MGTCELCGRKFSKASMTRRLRGGDQPKSPAQPAGAGKRRAPQSFHLVIEGRYAKGYWIHAAVPAAAPLSGLDQFLRRIRLECCSEWLACGSATRRTAAPNCWPATTRQKSVAMSARPGSP